MKRFNLKKFCREQDIPYVPVWYRLFIKGMTLDEAIIDVKLPPKSYRYCKYYWKGTPLKHYCKSNGLRYERIVKLIKNLKYTVEQAVRDEFKALSN